MAVVPICPIPKGLTKAQGQLYFQMVFQRYEFYCGTDWKNYKCWLHKEGRDPIKVNKRVALSLSKKNILIPDINHDIKKHNTCRFIINKTPDLF